MAVDNHPIAEARSLIERGIATLSGEGEQVTFTTLSVISDLRLALDHLSAVQTVVLPPVDLGPIDEGDVAAYEVPTAEVVGGGIEK